MVRLFQLSFATVLVVSSSFANAENHQNHLQGLNSMKNVYIAVRHGESVPSAERRVCGSMKEGIDVKNGLTDKGRKDVAESTQQWLDAHYDLVRDYYADGRLEILSSPFSRTTQTADIVAKTIHDFFKNEFPKTQKLPIHLENDLRERFFGDHEGKLNSEDIYGLVWAQDKRDPSHTLDNVESTTAVQARSSRLIAHLEKKSKMMYLLIGHGDTLKILQTAFQKQSSAEHQNEELVQPFKTAEFREMKLAR